MKTQKNCGKSRFTLRGRKKKIGVIKGKLRIRSMPGAFLVLGVVVVVVGTALAMAGYWPYRISKSSILGVTDGENISDSQTSGWRLGAKGFLSTASLIHSERMKLLGPVIMGVGLFILICANTVLYENRDRETQMLLAQMHSVLCSVSTAVPSADLKEIAAANSIAKHYQWISSLPAAHLNTLCLQELASSEPLFQTRHSDQENSNQGIYQLAVLQKEHLDHKESEPPPSSHSPEANSYVSCHADLNIQCGSEQGGNTSFTYQPTPLIKLNSCLVSSSSLSTLELDDINIPAAQPRRCHSMTHRTRQCVAQTVVCVEETFVQPKEDHNRQLGIVRREATSEVYRNNPEQVLGVAEDQAHGSWPQLDLGTGRKYLKLENKEDSVDKLLDQLEQQCSQWDKSFGSGPFQ